MSIEIKSVKSQKDLRQFINFNYELYKDSKYNVPYLFFDEKNTLNKDKNAAFEFCDAEYLMAFKEGRMVGRVAAIINNKANEKWKMKAVRFGWLDFIDDAEVSEALLRAVEKYGKQHGMDTVVGPLGFTDLDREGMLIDGFEEMGNMYTNYNFPYYPKHLESLGFAKDYDYIESVINIPDRIPDKFLKIANIARTRYNLQTYKPTREELLKKGFAKAIFDNINITYKDLFGYSELSDRQIEQYVSSYIGSADTNLVVVIVDANEDNKVVGFGISFPSFAKALQHTRKGRLFPFGWWHLLKALKLHQTDDVDLLLIGVLPEYRIKGANALIFCDLLGKYIEYGFKCAHAMPQLETNEIALSSWNYFDARPYRRRRCYTKEIK
ncbi:MAG: N-acetyltransferase [Prevotella sp.]|nr:N-acetyltransferase [Candidatus Equicola stercoris]